MSKELTGGEMYYHKLSGHDYGDWEEKKLHGGGTKWFRVCNICGMMETTNAMPKEFVSKTEESLIGKKVVILNGSKNILTNYKIGVITDSCEEKGAIIQYKVMDANNEEYYGYYGRDFVSIDYYKQLLKQALEELNVKEDELKSRILEPKKIINSHS